MIRFESVSWKNFLSTGNSENKIALNAHQSTLIVGKNGEGKSTVLDALCFGLFGKPFRNVNKGQLVNSINMKNCLIEVEFSIGKNSYKVIRGIRPNKFEIYQNDELLSQDAAAKDYQKVLEQSILKLNYKTFTQVVILGSASFVPFMQLPGSTRREVIEEILDIKIFSTMNQLLKEKIQGTKDELLKIENLVTIAKGKVESQQQIIKTLNEAKKDSISAIDTRIKSTQDEISTVTAAISAAQSAIDELQGKIQDSQTVAEGIENAKKLIGKKNHKTQGIETTLDFFKDNDTCSLCSQDIPHEHKSSMVEKLKEEHEQNEKALESLETAYKKLQDRVKIISDIQQQITEKTIEVSGYNSTVTTLNKLIGELNQEREDKREDTADIDGEIQAGSCANT